MQPDRPGAPAPSSCRQCGQNTQTVWSSDGDAVLGLVTTREPPAAAVRCKSIRVLVRAHPTEPRGRGLRSLVRRVVPVSSLLRMTPTQPPGRLMRTWISRLTVTLRGVMLVRSRTYEITFTGRAGPVTRAEFDDCTVIVGPDTTTLRA